MTSDVGCRGDRENSIVYTSLQIILSVDRNLDLVFLNIGFHLMF